MSLTTREREDVKEIVRLVLAEGRAHLDSVIGTKIQTHNILCAKDRDLVYKEGEIGYHVAKGDYYATFDWLFIWCFWFLLKNGSGCSNKSPNKIKEGVSYDELENDSCRNLFPILTAVVGVVQSLIAGHAIDWTNTIAAIMAGIGLITAKDSNVTGGTKDNGQTVTV